MNMNMEIDNMMDVEMDMDVDMDTETTFMIDSIGQDCINIIEDYKYDLELNEHNKKFKNVVDTMFCKIKAKKFFRLRKRYYEGDYVMNCETCNSVNNSKHINNVRDSKNYIWKHKMDSFKCINCEENNIIDNDIRRTIV